MRVPGGALPRRRLQIAFMSRRPMTLRIRFVNYIGAIDPYGWSHLCVSNTPALQASRWKDRAKNSMDTTRWILVFRACSKRKINNLLVSVVVNHAIRLGQRLNFVIHIHRIE